MHYGFTYIGNDNTSGDAPATDSYNAPTTILPTGTLERTGYTIEGWNTNANGSGTDYAVGATYSDGVNLTLYAKWTKNIAILPDAATNIRLTTATLGKYYSSRSSCNRPRNMLEHIIWCYYI